MGESNVSIVLLNSVLHRSSSLSDVYLATFEGNPVNHAILFSRADSVFWRCLSKNTKTGEPCDSGPPREQITERSATIEMHQLELLKNN